MDRSWFPDRLRDLLKTCKCDPRPMTYDPCECITDWPLKCPCCSANCAFSEYYLFMESAIAIRCGKCKKINVLGSDEPWVSVYDPGIYGILNDRAKKSRETLA